jgi:hypothetical protein
MCSGLRDYDAEPGLRTFSADLGAVVVTVFKDFVSIMRTAEGLTLEDVVTNIVVFVTIGTHRQSLGSSPGAGAQCSWC